MNKTDLEKLVDIRVKEAKTLLDEGLYQGAYYLAGYSLECAIKVCITKQVKAFDFPSKDLAQKSHQHKLTELLGVAGLKQKLSQNENQDQKFQVFWAIAKDWTVESRYDHSISEQTAKDLYEAVTDNQSGILEWLKKFW